MVAYAYPTLSYTEGMKHHERFAACMNRTVEHLQSTGMKQGDAVTLVSFLGMAHVGAAQKNSDLSPKSMMDSTYDFYKKAQLEAPAKTDVQRGIDFFQKDMAQHQVDLQQVAGYVYDTPKDADLNDEENDISASQDLTLRESSSDMVPAQEVLEGDVVDDSDAAAGLMPEDEDVDAEFDAYKTKRRNPDLSSQLMTLLDHTGMTIRRSAGLGQGNKWSFKSHLANNRAKHLETASKKLQEFDNLVQRGPKQGQSFVDHEKELKKSANAFMKHVHKGLSEPGLSNAIKNGADQKTIGKLQESFNEWKSMNGDLMEKMKLDKIAENIAKMFSNLFSRASGASPS